MIDSAKLTIKAGKGGDGSVHFHRAKFIRKGGPDGGDGGRGGSVYINSDPNLATLDHFAFKQKIEAKSGNGGTGDKSSGLAADDLHIHVPLGTVVKFYNPETLELAKEIDFDRVGMEELVAKGGKGGRGNWRFRSSVNTTPMEAEDGTPGESWVVEMDLKLLADVGLVGVPNVGKSTLLSILSNAKPKIADYEFTTLEPNLGVLKIQRANKVRSVVIADIPGLIEGASEGKGLGIQFLRHIERTKLIVHLLALKNGEENLGVEEAVEKLVSNYEKIRKEMGSYSKKILKKKEIVVLNKTDIMDPEKLAIIVGELAEKDIKVIPISSGTTSGIEELKTEISRLVKK